MTPPDPQQVAEIAGRLSKAQRWFVCALHNFWVHPGDIGASPSVTGPRDRTLIEASCVGQGREYRLTPLGLAVRNFIQGNSHD